MLDVYELQVFLAAAETENFSEAGRQLSMSQPAVSMQIRSLENRLGLELFTRSGRHISLTEAGHALVPMARDLVNLSIQVGEAMASLQGKVMGHLILGCSTTAGKYVLPRLVGAFVEQHPDVQVTCRVVPRGTALQMARDGEVHLSVTSLREPHKDLEYRLFTTDRVVLIVPPDHPWAGVECVMPGDLLEGRFILREQESGTQQAVAAALSEHDLSASDLQPIMILGSSEAIYMAVAEHIGPGFVSQRVAADGIAAGRVVEVPIAGLEMCQELYTARHTQRAPTRAQTAFWDFVYAPENAALLNADVQVAPAP